MGEEASTQETPEKKAGPKDKKVEDGKLILKYSIGGQDGRKANEFNETTKAVALRVGNKFGMTMKRLVLNEGTVEEIAEEPECPNKSDCGVDKDKPKGKCKGDAAKWRM